VRAVAYYLIVQCIVALRKKLNVMAEYSAVNFTCDKSADVVGN